MIIKLDKLQSIGQRIRCVRNSIIQRPGTFKRWFAWHPVEVASGEIVWLQTVDRKKHGGYSYVVYSYFIV
jgi:hypothetical protein